MYRIIGADGKEYGPISVDQLRQWMAEGRANLQTKVQLEGTTDWKMLGELPEFAGPPPGAVPGTPPSLGSQPGPFAAAPVSISGASDKVNAPAIALIVVGALDLIFAIIRVIFSVVGGGASMFPRSGMNDEMQRMIAALSGTVGTFAGIIGIVGGLFVLFGGLKMMKKQSYGLAMAASIIAMIPCLSACCPIGLPIGIWALVILSKPEVKALFR